MAASDEEAKERCLEAYRGERLKGVYIRAKKVNEQFGRKMNQNEDVNGNRKGFRKEASNARGGKVESCSRKDGNGRLSQGEDEVQRIWEYLKICII